MAPQFAPEPLEAGRVMCGLSISELWTAYLGVGGNLSEEEISAFLAYGGSLPSIEFDRLTQAVNEEFQSYGEDHPLPYSDDLGD